MADTQDLSFMFEEPMSPSEQLFESNTGERQEEKRPTASSEELDSLFSKVEQNEENKRKQATWSDVFKSGGIRAAAGMPQGFLALAEANNLVDQGTTANFTRQVLAYEQAGEMGLAKELTRDTLANIIPIVAEIAATRGVSLKSALGRSTAIGAGGGFFSFVENPEQAAATSMARFLNTGTGAVLSPMFMAAGAGIGRGFSYLRGTRGEQQVGAPDLVPEQSIKEAGAETIEQAAQRGITLSPGAATADPALVAQELKYGGAFSQETQRFLADVIGTNAKNTQELIDDLVSTIIPEGKEGIEEAVGRFYSEAAKEVMPSEVAQPFRRDKTIEALITKILKDPSSKAAYESFPANSIGRFNFVIKELQKKIDDVSGTDTAAHLIDLKRKMQKAASGVSENYRLAVDAAQRSKTAVEVMEALTKQGAGEIVPHTNFATSFVSNFSKKEVKEKMAFGIKSLSDPKQKQEALAKMDFLLKLLPKVSQMEGTLQKFLGLSEDELAKRGGAGQAALYTLNNVLNSNNNEAFVRFMLDPSKSADRLRELLPARNTTAEETLKAFGVIFGEIMEEEVGALSQVPYRPGEKEALETSSVSSKAKAYEKLAESGKIEELMVKNPDAYSILKKAHQKRAIV